MARKNALAGGGEYEHHVVAVRMRVIGSGNLRLSLVDLDDTRTSNLTNLVMSATTRYEPTVLANFQSQRIRLVGMVTDTDEWFEAGRIIIFAKPVAVEYPQ